jgi:DNA-binding NarL/FixJ family response regulator
MVHSPRAISRKKRGIRGPVRTSLRAARPQKPPLASESVPAARLTVVVAARPALVRELLARQLGNESGLMIVGLARDEDGISALLSKDKPQVLLLDYEGLGPNTEGMIPRLRRASSSTRILVLATRSTDETVERVLRVGAMGLVGKQLGFATLVRAIRVVAAGELWANRRVTAQTVEHLADGADRSSWDGQLTQREIEIAMAVGRGLRNKDIARRLSISEKTVKSHLNNIFRKLNVDNRFAVGLYALDIKPAN